LRIVVCDDGRDRTPGAAVGHGLVGMRERVAVYAGSLDAGPIFGGGFRVDATVPLQPLVRPRSTSSWLTIRRWCVVAFYVLLRSSGDIEVVVVVAADGAEAVDVVVRERPDVVLMDIRMPRMDGVQATRAITSLPRLTANKVLVLSTIDLDEYVFEAIWAGASGFLLEDTMPDDLLTAVRLVSDGQSLLAPTIACRLLAEFARRPVVGGAPLAGLGTLNTREVELLVDVARGLSHRRGRCVAAHVDGDGEDPRQPASPQAPGTRQGPAGDARLRVGCRGTRIAVGLTGRLEPRARSTVEERQSERSGRRPRPDHHHHEAHACASGRAGLRRVLSWSTSPATPGPASGVTPGSGRGRVRRWLERCGARSRRRAG